MGGTPDALERVLSAWRRAPDHLETTGPATDAELGAAERALGRPLPEDLGRLLRFGNGLSALGGNLSIEPVGGADGGLVTYADRLREWGWVIAHELLVVGGNGAEELFALWYPPTADPRAPTPVVMVAGTFEAACLALVGSSLPRFLLAWSGYYLVLLEASTEALDALGLPEELRTIDDEAGMGPFFAWSDPALPEYGPDPYGRGTDGLGIARLIRDLGT